MTASSSPALSERAREQDKSAADARFTALQEQLTKIREDAAANEARIRAEAREVGAHKALWEKRGRILTSVLKAHGDFCSTLERIIGTAD